MNQLTEQELHLLFLYAESEGADPIDARAAGPIAALLALPAGAQAARLRPIKDAAVAAAESRRAAAAAQKAAWEAL